MHKISKSSSISTTLVPLFSRKLNFKQWRQDFCKDPNRSYVIAAKIKRNSVKKALYWDNADGDHSANNRVLPYHYVMIQESDNQQEEDLLVAGGGDHPVGKDVNFDNIFSDLENWVKKRFPIGEIAFRWSGQVLEPLDFLAFIGKNPGSNKKRIYRNRRFWKWNDSWNYCRYYNK